MLTIGEFSNICKVSTKTLRYYEEIELIIPEEINPVNGYRYYSIHQLKTMLFINRLKSYNFSLSEIKPLIKTYEFIDEKLCFALHNKRNLIKSQMNELNQTLEQLNQDILRLSNGQPVMSYLDSIEVNLVEVKNRVLLFIRKMIPKCDMEQQYQQCYHDLFTKIAKEQLTVLGAPMVLFHSSEFSPLGLDVEFAIPIKECVKGTRDFNPGLCIKSVLCGSYSELTSIYSKQREWAEQEGYENHDALFEIYVTDPSVSLNTRELITEIYYPIRKKKQ